MSMDEVMQDGMDEAAARWFARARAGDMTARERSALASWLNERPEHRVAYEDMQAAWELTSAAASHEAVRAMRAAALTAGPAAEASSWRRKGLWSAAVAACLVAAVGAVLWLNPEARGLAARVVSNSPERAYSTAVGERSTINLEDGSTVVLNTDTRMRVAYSPGQRAITLLQGQALFEVAKDASRPFVVQAGDRRIVAVGTAFDVRMDQKSVQVTLIEGRINVEESGRKSGGQAPRRAHMEAGQQLIAPLHASGPGAATPDMMRTADAVVATSWRDGRVVFQNEKLHTVVAELNRYSERKIRLQDQSLGELRLSGTFVTGNPSRFAAAVHEYFPVQVVDQAGTDLELRWR
ncbi:FecR family protein [Steroidobacter sp.]|uniref:FecR family protein n=1 Tax=Steroidobacter sp. TaxID=1978227 RepID=UPI001A3BA69A|nr:FecR domain-containing protein [Steroidobacter sp.]MBL8266499.1 FecR domain-containing protein [Steroidobacter sp.]